MERRQSTRIPFKALAFVFPGGRAVASEVLDISRRGLFIKTRNDYNKAEKTFVTINLHHGNRSVSVTIPCSVARVTDSGIGCTSPYLEPEALLFISNLLHSRRTAPTEFVRNFYSYLDGLEFHGYLRNLPGLH